MTMSNPIEVDLDTGLTTCCLAFTTYMDDGNDGWIECCKACCAEISGWAGVAH